MSRILRLNDSDGDPIGTALSIHSLTRLFENFLPGRDRIDEISHDPFPSGHTSRRWGIAVKRNDLSVSIARQVWHTIGRAGFSVVVAPSLISLSRIGQCPGVKLKEARRHKGPKRESWTDSNHCPWLACPALQSIESAAGSEIGHRSVLHVFGKNRR
jgi:hypothetical protein